MKKYLLLIFSILAFCSVSGQVYLSENFDTSIPATWTITDGGEATGDSWFSGKVGTSSLDGSNCAVVNSDAANPGSHLIETLTSPIIDTSSATK